MAVVVADAAEAEVVEDGCTTPTAAEYRISEAVACPPAPRKPRSRPVPGGAPPVGGKKFFVPPNLEAVFAVHKAYREPRDKY